MRLLTGNPGKDPFVFVLTPSDSASLQEMMDKTIAVLDGFWAHHHTGSATHLSEYSTQFYTQGGHKLRFFKGGKARFVTVGII